MVIAPQRGSSKRRGGTGGSTGATFSDLGVVTSGEGKAVLQAADIVGAVFGAKLLESAGGQPKALKRGQSLPASDGNRFVLSAALLIPKSVSGGGRRVIS